ncbi:MAG: hypothetical protein JRI47_04525 [Deltaproteobacteria bacterium]|nr:hypothetical protein [Deltaproteobacteria bacterium]
MTPPSDRHPKTLDVAKQIDALLSEVISLQQDYVAQLCPVCEEPCCRRVSYLFDEKDVIFARVLGRNGARGRKRRTTEAGCPYLSPTGCRLTPHIRPFTCHRYLCETLKQEMTKQDAALVSTLEQKFRILEELRVRLWGAYVEI